MLLLYLLSTFFCFSYDFGYSSESIPSTNPIFQNNSNILLASANHTPFEHPSEESLSSKIMVAGYYDAQDESFIVPVMKRIRDDVTIPSSSTQNEELPLVTFQLVDRNENQILKKTQQPAIEMEVEIFYKDRKPETAPFPASPFLVIFELPEDNKHRNLWVEVLSHKGNLIYSIPVKEITEKHEDIFVTEDHIDQ